MDFESMNIKTKQNAFRTHNTLKLDEIHAVPNDGQILNIFNAVISGVNETQCMISRTDKEVAQSMSQDYVAQVHLNALESNNLVLKAHKSATVSSSIQVALTDAPQLTNPPILPTPEVKNTLALCDDVGLAVFHNTCSIDRNLNPQLDPSSTTPPLHVTLYTLQQ